MGHQLDDVFRALLLHFLEDVLRGILGKVLQQVRRFAGGHLLDDVGRLRGVEVLDQADLDFRVRFLQGFGGGLHVEGLEDGGPLVDVQLLDDVREIRRVQLGQAALRDLEPQQVGRCQGLDELPGDELVGQGIVKKPVQQGIHEPLHADPPHQPPEADVHMDQVQPLARLQKLQVVDAPDLGPVGVHDLLVQEGLLQQEFVVAQGRFPEVLREQQVHLEPVPGLVDLMPCDERRGFAAPGLEKNAGHGWIRLGQVGHQVNDFADRTAFGIDDARSQDLAQKQENLRFTNGCHDRCLRVSRL